MADLDRLIAEEEAAWQIAKAAARQFARNPTPVNDARRRTAATEAEWALERLRAAMHDAAPLRR